MGGESQPIIEVCFGPQCSDAGGRELAKDLEASGLEICMGDCRNQCPHAPAVLVNNRLVTKATQEKVLEKVKSVNR